MNPSRKINQPNHTQDEKQKDDFENHPLWSLMGSLLTMSFLEKDATTDPDSREANHIDSEMNVKPEEQPGSSPGRNDLSKPIPSLKSFVGKEARIFLGDTVLGRGVLQQSDGTTELSVTDWISGLTTDDLLNIQFDLSISSEYQTIPSGEFFKTIETGGEIRLPDVVETHFRLCLEDLPIAKGEIVEKKGSGEYSFCLTDDLDSAFGKTLPRVQRANFPDLRVRVVFASAGMVLRNIMELKKGDVVDFHKHISSPVQLETERGEKYPARWSITEGGFTLSFSKEDDERPVLTTEMLRRLRGL